MKSIGDDGQHNHPTEPGFEESHETDSEDDGPPPLEEAEPPTQAE